MSDAFLACDLHLKARKIELGAKKSMYGIERVFLIVLDSVGAGEAPDAEAFGDAGAHTLLSAFNTGILNIPTLLSLGMGNIDGLSFLGKTEAPMARFARMTEASAGKDTTVGHWEIAGHISSRPLPTFPDGFPPYILKKIEKILGSDVLCNKPFSGTELLEVYGDEHVTSGKPIVYTSADSVLQIAVHTDVIPLAELYRKCAEVRNIMQGSELGVGRVIARPFTGKSGAYVRTSERRDFSLEPPRGLVTDAVLASGADSIAVGKINDIFAGRGFSKSFYTHSNAEGMDTCSHIAKTDFKGLCFVNLVDFDMLWGHRRNALAYAEGLNRFDEWLGAFIKSLTDRDMLIITADHGCDPAFVKTTDHTREYTPCLIYSAHVSPRNMGTLKTFADIAATVACALGIDLECVGKTMI